MGKQRRQLLIKQIVTDNLVGRQEELLVLLQKHSVDATQATISRDIKELGIIKVPGKDGSVHYALQSEQAKKAISPISELFSDSVINLTRVQFMLIINTTLGSANVVAAEIDNLEMPEVVGSLAGTDTIVLISSSDENAQKVYDILSDYMLPMGGK